MPPTEEDLAWFKSTFHPIPKAQLPDDCVEYSLHIFAGTNDHPNDSEVRDRLREVQKHGSLLQKQWIKDYIWQRQSFNLALTKENGISLLQGRTEYGDSVEDEWVVVWLLRELTKKFQDLWVKVTDSDGEFLLIEASATLPGWLEPEVAENRVWINTGGLVIVRPETAAKAKQKIEKLTIEAAKQIILEKPTRLLKSTSIQEEAFYRLRNYPAQIQENMHHAMVVIPRKVVFLLRQKPAYVAPAVESFYIRDPIALKPLQAKSSLDKIFFTPEDLVTISIKIPRVAYAQLKSQAFPAPWFWNGKLPSQSEQLAYGRAETGMKLTSGFEMLISDPHNQDKATVREMKMLLEDIDTGDEKLPTNQEISSWSQRQDDEKWLDISFEDLEGELAGKDGERSAGKKPRGQFGDVGAQENLQRIVKQFEAFLNDDKAGPEGATMFDDDDSSAENLDDDDFDEDDLSDSGEDKEASFDEDEFTKMMREAMGMPPEVMRELMAGKDLRPQAESHNSTILPKSGRVEDIEDSDSQSDDEEEMKQMEAELRESGVLNLESSAKKSSTSNRAIKGTNEENHREIAGEADDNGDGSSDDGSENDIEVNLAKNLLESLKSQAGTAGPGGNIMGLMGVKMPRDEADRKGRLHEGQEDST